MDAFKITIKLYAESDTFAPAEFVPVFHGWIQNQSFPDHLLIDVTDYAHVPAGPGTLVVSSEANVHMDRGDNRLGLLYVRKRPIPGATNFREQMRGTLAAALTAAALLEADPALSGRLRFRTDEIAVRINDRLLAPNTVETFEAVKEDVEAVATELHGGATVSLALTASSLSLFEVVVRTPQNAPIAGLFDRLGVTSHA